MTREEAIECMSERVSIGKTCEQSCMVGFGVNIDTLDEAFDMAISALRQQDHFRDITKKVEPLTLEELRRMEGQPVYIVENTEYWAIVNSFDQAGVYLLSYGNPDDYGYFGLYGKTWLAYRQKPEEDDHDERKENENV